MSYFTEAGYTQNTVFKVLKNYEGLEEGQLVVLHSDDYTTSPTFKNADSIYAYMYLPDTDYLDFQDQDLEVVALDGIKKGILDEDDGKPYFTTYDEWIESKTANNNTPTYEVGEIVKIVGNTCNHGFDIGEKVRITNLRIGASGSAEYLDKNDWWAFNFEDIEKLPNETKEKEVKMIEVETKSYKTPFEQKGYTKDSVFEVIEESWTTEFPIGHKVKLYLDDGSYTPAFTHLEGSVTKTRWVPLENLKYVGEYTDYSQKESCIVADVLKTQQTLRTPQDYRLMNPDDKIKIVVDGHESEVKLGDLISITAVGGASTGIYGYSLWSFLHETFGDTTTFDGTKFDVGEKQIELFDEYFLPRKQKELKEKSASKQKERKDLDSEIQKLQSELEKL